MPGLTTHYSHHQVVNREQGAVRTINFAIDRSHSDVSLGFNVRGGAEFGLGIFISSVTEGSIADRAGFIPGDQILSINGKSFEDITHEEAVSFITSLSSLSVTVMATGKVPDEKIVVYSAPPQIHDSAEVAKPQKASSVNQNETLVASNTSNEVNNSGTEKKSSKSKSEKSKSSKGSSKGSKRLSKKNGSIKNTEKKLESIRSERDRLVNEIHESIKVSFSIDESEIINQSIALYHNGESVENFLNRILPLFTPLKFSLLRNIRKVIYADEVLKYDCLVTSYLGRKKRESLYGRRAKSVTSPPSAWSEDQASEPSKHVQHGVPLPGMQGGQVATEIVLRPVKSTYISKDTAAKKNEQKQVEPLASESTDFHFQPPETVIAEPKVESTPPRTDLKTSLSLPASIDPIYSIPMKVNKVVTEVEKTEIISKPVREPSFQVKKKLSGDSTVISVEKTNSEDKDSVLVFEDSSYNEDSNTLTINAKLNIDNMKVKKDDSIKISPAVVDHSATAADDPVVINGEDVVVKELAKAEDVIVVTEPTKAENVIVVTEPAKAEDVIVVTEPAKADDVILTVESSPMPPLPTTTVHVDQQLSSDNDVKDNDKQVYEIDKSHQFIGLSISGGSDSRYQREIRVVSVNPNSASHHAGMQVGQVLLSIDDQSLLDLTHAEACQLIRSTFRNKTNTIMKVCVEGDGD